MANIPSLVLFCSLSYVLSPTVLPCLRFSCSNQQLAWHFSVSLYFFNTAVFSSEKAPLRSHGKLPLGYKSKFAATPPAQTILLHFGNQENDMNCMQKHNSAFLTWNNEEMPTWAVMKNGTKKYLHKAVEQKVVKSTENFWAAGRTTVRPWLSTIHCHSGSPENTEYL